MIQHHFHFHFLPRKEIFDHNFITEALDKFFKTIPIGDMAPSIVTDTRDTNAWTFEAGHVWHDRIRCKTVNKYKCTKANV